MKILEARNADETQRRWVYDLMVKYDIFANSRRLAKEYNQITTDEIDRLHIPDAYKQQLHRFSEFATLRRKT